MSTITVFIADRERGSRTACLRLLRPAKGIRVVGQAGSITEALVAGRLKPRILLLDLSLSGRNRRGVIPIVRRLSPATRIILLTRRVSENRILDTLGPGVPGYLEKRSLRAFLAKAVRGVDAGEAWIPRRMIGKIVECLARPSARPAER